MRTFSLLKGLPVYELKGGRKLGEVCDLCISEDGSVRGLLIKKKSLLKKTLFVSIQHVASFGSDGVMLEQENLLEQAFPEPKYTLLHDRGLMGKMVMSAEGEKLGLVKDVYFLEELGTIVGYECTDGFFSDLKEGKRVVKTDQPPAFGKDAIIVNVKTM